MLFCFSSATVESDATEASANRSSQVLSQAVRVQLNNGFSKGEPKSFICRHRTRTAVV